MTHEKDMSVTSCLGPAFIRVPYCFIIIRIVSWTDQTCFLVPLFALYSTVYYSIFILLLFLTR